MLNYIKNKYESYKRLRFLKKLYNVDLYSLIKEKDGYLFYFCASKSKLVTEKHWNSLYIPRHIFIKKTFDYEDGKEYYYIFFDYFSTFDLYNLKELKCGDSSYFYMRLKNYDFIRCVKVPHLDLNELNKILDCLEGKYREVAEELFIFLFESYKEEVLEKARKMLRKNNRIDYARTLVKG